MMNLREERRTFFIIRPKTVLIEKFSELIEEDLVRDWVEGPTVVYSEDLNCDFDTYEFHYPSLLRNSREQYFKVFIEFWEGYRVGITEKVLGDLIFTVELFNKWWVIEPASSVKVNLNK